MNTIYIPRDGRKPESLKALTPRCCNHFLLCGFDILDFTVFFPLAQSFALILPSRADGRPRWTWGPSLCYRPSRAWSSSLRTAPAAFQAVPRRSLATLSQSSIRTLGAQRQELSATRPVIKLANFVWLATVVPTVSPTTAMRRTSVSWHTFVCDCNCGEPSE